MKKIISILIISLLLSILAYAYTCCPNTFDSDNEVEPIIGLGLFRFLKDPPNLLPTSSVTENEIHDIIDFYNSFDQNCNSIGTRSNQRILDIANRIQYVGDASCPSGPFTPPFLVIQNSGANDVAIFDDMGNIGLKGNCTAPAGGCNYPGDDAFVLKNAAGFTVAFINRSGDLCVEDFVNGCQDLDANCNNPVGSSLIIQKASTGEIVSYIDENGDLCLRGKIMAKIIP